MEILGEGAAGALGERTAGVASIDWIRVVPEHDTRTAQSAGTSTKWIRRDITRA